MDPNQAQALLGGLSPAQFMHRHWHKQPLWVREAVPRVVSPVTRAEMFALAARDDVESRLIRCDEGHRWHLRHGPLPRRALPALAQAGWTLLVQGLDLHVDAAHELLARFRFVPAARLDDLMLSYASDGGGVGPHVDSYDVFLLQVQGRRRWRIARVEQPTLRDDVPLKMLARFVPEQEALLEPGDMLYLPPGWAHEGVAVGGDCLTASIGFRAPRADELAQALLARLADGAGEDKAGLRYRDAGQPATTSPGAVPESLQRFARRAVTSALRDPSALERTLGEWLTEPKPQVWFDASRVAQNAHGGVRLDRRTRMAYDARHIFINGESLRAAGRDARLVRMLADRRRLDAASMHRASAQAQALLAEWLGNGWLHALD
ncbi:MAG: cupin domain-containing protein [Pseudomonadota bacterium]